MKKLVALLAFGMMVTMAIATAQGHQGILSGGGDFPGTKIDDCCDCHGKPGLIAMDLDGPQCPPPGQ